MSARARGVVLVCSLAAAIMGVMVVLDSERGEPGEGGKKRKGVSAAVGSADAGADGWQDDAGGPAIDDDAGPQAAEPDSAGGAELAVATAQPVAGSEAEAESESDPGGPVVELASSPDGPLYVTGAGIDGLTPQRTQPLGAGPHRLRLVGGRGAPPVDLILNSQPPRLDATLSGDGTEALRITCHGGVAGPEPLTTPVGARLVCWIRGPSGTLTTELRVVGR
jgi:hypothetical protein